MNAESSNATPRDLAGLDSTCVSLLGIPFDANSSLHRGAALAPAAIRTFLASGSSNLTAENRICIENPRFKDIGNINLTNDSTGFVSIEATAREVLDRGARLLALGGDHSISFPLVKAIAARVNSLTILHLDAHADLYEIFQDNRFSHACPFARIMEAGLAARLVQVGVRTMNEHQRRQASRFGAEVHEMKGRDPAWRLKANGPVYLSLDLDVIEPGLAPGVSHPEPGGLTPREVLHIIQSVQGQLVGADIVEYNPTRDLSEITASVAVKMLKEIAGRMMADSGP